MLPPIIMPSKKNLIFCLWFSWVDNIRKISRQKKEIISVCALFLKKVRLEQLQGLQFTKKLHKNLTLCFIDTYDRNSIKIGTVLYVTDFSLEY